MKLQGTTLKAINTSLKEHLDSLSGIARPAFDIRAESFDVSVTEKGGVWEIRFVPGESIMQEVRRSHRDADVLKDYVRMFVIRKSDFRVMAQYDGLY